MSCGSGEVPGRSTYFSAGHFTTRALHSRTMISPEHYSWKWGITESRYLSYAESSFLAFPEVCALLPAVSHHVNSGSECVVHEKS